MIIDFKEGERVKAQLLIASVSRGVNNFGAPYLSLELRDASGTISAKKWEVSAEDETNLVSGTVINVEGEVLKYKESLQMKVLSAKALTEDEIDVTKFIKAPPIPREELEARLHAYVESINDPDCSKLLHYFIKKYEKKIYTYPAGVTVHHEYSSGLLVHLTTMAKVADQLAAIYQPINRDLLVTGVLLHDIGKLTELEGTIIYKYSLEGKLLGHISLMVGEIRQAAEELQLTSETPTLLAHMVLSHHDKPEFGSPIPPLTKEALLLTMIDNLDSKMVIVQKALDATKEGEFTQKIFPLDNKMFYKHK